MFLPKVRWHLTLQKDTTSVWANVKCNDSICLAQIYMLKGRPRERTETEGGEVSKYVLSAGSFNKTNKTIQWRYQVLLVFAEAADTLTAGYNDIYFETNILLFAKIIKQNSSQILLAGCHQPFHFEATFDSDGQKENKKASFYDCLERKDTSSFDRCDWEKSAYL